MAHACLLYIPIQSQIRYKAAHIFEKIGEYIYQIKIIDKLFNTRSPTHTQTHTCDLGHVVLPFQS